MKDAFFRQILTFSPFFLKLKFEIYPQTKFELDPMKLETLEVLGVVIHEYEDNVI